ncbi:hypothetical protein HUJ04_012866 [Dendroctonus ponderosae]|nr:hypothetical protein HUJ04_012866 [Dendroctonus ponderosae]
MKKFKKATAQPLHTTADQRETAMRFLQVNFNRCRKAYDLMYRKMFEDNTNVTLGQEPNKALSYNTTLCDDARDVFINVSRGLRVKREFRGIGYVGVELEDLSVFSVYFSPNGDNEDFEKLRNDLDLDPFEVRFSVQSIVIGFKIL